MGIQAGLLAFQGISSAAQGRSAQKQAEANAAIDRANAEQALDEGRRRALARRIEGQEAAKTIQTQTAAGGFTQEGTSLENQIDVIKTAELNALEETRVAQVEGKRHRQSAAQNVRRGKVAFRSGLLRGVGSGIEAAGQIFQQRQDKIAELS